MIKILLGGFPCTKFSIAQKSMDRETQPYSGEGWELFMNYLTAKEKFKPDYFIAENNRSISQDIKDEVSKLLGVNYIEINSALVSAQSRSRVYWTNIPNVEQPKDRHIKLSDIIESGCVDRDKSLCVARRYAGFSGSQSYLRRRYFGKSMGQAVFEKTTPEKQKALWKADPYKEYETEGYIRQMTPIECERLQTLPDNYTYGIPDRWRYECIGNGWTAEIIIHILSYLNIHKDEEIVVLSMYDGIATGRYCLEKLGYTNITYYAYEIDKYAMQIANKNYPDIIQCGDAFNVRKDDWFLTCKDELKKVI
jgi:site-specific DNA-cytosine methylase